MSGGRQTARYDFPDGWTKFVIKRRQVSKAWGPSPETILRRAERVEFVVVAAEGGKGSVEIDQLTLRALPVDPPDPASTGRQRWADGLRRPPANAVDLDPKTAWTPPVGEASALTLDLGYEREFGGLTLRWGERGAASDYRVSASIPTGATGANWRRSRAATAASTG